MGIHLHFKQLPYMRFMSVTVNADQRTVCHTQEHIHILILNFSYLLSYFCWVCKYNCLKSYSPNSLNQTNFHLISPTCCIYEILTLAYSAPPNYYYLHKADQVSFIKMLPRRRTSQALSLGVRHQGTQKDQKNLEQHNTVTEINKQAMLEFRC